MRLWTSKEIIERLVKRYLLVDVTMEKNKLELLQYILPVTSVDELLRNVIFSSEIKTPGATGRLLTHTVPSGKRWRLIAYSVARSGAGDATYSEISVGENGGLATGLPIETFTAVVGKNGTFSAENLWLPEGWEVGPTLAAWTTGNTIMTLILEEEDAY